MEGMEKEDVRRSTIRQVRWRILWFMLIPCIFNSIDRTNVGYAALQMNGELNFSPAIFGFGVSMFFVGYSIFQIPNSLAFERYGVRQFLAVTLVIWGVVGAGMALIHDPMSFYIMRFLIGCAEAGFAGAVIYLFGCWMPQEARARATAVNTLAISLTAMLSGPISGWLIEHHIGGISGWQWMFIVEGAPAALIGIIIWFYLPNNPDEASFLSPQQRAWLNAELASDQAGVARRGALTFRDALTNLRVWLLVGVWFAVLLGFYAITYWLPLAIKQVAGVGISDVEIGALSSLPWVSAMIGGLVNTWHSDRTQERYWHLGGAMLLTAFGLAFAFSVTDPRLSLLGLVITGFGLGSAHGVFWTVPMTFLTGAAAAGGYAVLNLFGNFSGFFGSNLVGIIRQQTGSYTMALYAISLVMVLGAALLILVHRISAAKARSDALTDRIAASSLGGT
jgi:ACS family tartrate transporter-like MFS transporter